ncbi:hypothetical protein ASPZODRAFT_128091 [Penicilliopsis zonata CBS 506.65]|uniref:Phosphatidylinositol-specific phospholipase C X domain-containing protein n=1 Tax=Penicilliopsis zonata CBS 506.65 TaxID=1073090 RepID=A0A1L9SQV2_9EURO|nr:hypothetical protein ASPZODRAFT_128091 [Penicilliopsis zonata CBS 506.65]OJJ49605.1 hypothetical protein ASPZODRAFT_128091 [Penicilliopsis zonata CBS 506.65]
MRLLLLLSLLGVAPVWAKDKTTTSSSTTETDATTTGSLLTVEGTISTVSAEATVPTGDYLSYTSTITLSTDSAGEVYTSVVTGNETGTATKTTTVTTTSGNSTETTTQTTTSVSVTVLVGGQTATGNSTANATSTTSAAATSTSQVVNTQPCNGYPEFCARQYSNITMVTAHNSPFVRPGNIASNQALDVTSQLNDGIRMLQFQTHLVNGTMYLCHTSCELLNMGPLEDYLTTVAKWMKKNPYDVVTILVGNGDYVAPGNYTSAFQNSGILDYVYTPSVIPMSVDDWPTLSSMILNGNRLVVFMDYEANQSKIPWLMDEFTQIWETPFSPVNRDFPCTIQRPPGLSANASKSHMYMANHNLNLEVSIAGLDMLIPNTALLDVTNAVSGYGSLGRMANNCSEKWNRPPNFLLVDYYNYGNFNGSVFEVAAKMNGVNYTAKCCDVTSGASMPITGRRTAVFMTFIAGLHLLSYL